MLQSYAVRHQALVNLGNAILDAQDRQIRREGRLLIVRSGNMDTTPEVLSSRPPHKWKLKTITNASQS